MNNKQWPPHLKNLLFSYITDTWLHLTALYRCNYLSTSYIRCWLVKKVPGFEK